MLPVTGYLGTVTETIYAVFSCGSSGTVVGERGLIAILAYGLTVRILVGRVYGIRLDSMEKIIYLRLQTPAELAIFCAIQLDQDG